MSINPILNGQISILTRQHLEQFIQGKKIDLSNVEISFLPQRNSINQYNSLSQEPDITQQQQQQQQTLPQLLSQKLTQGQILPIINQDQELLKQEPQVQQTQQQKTQEQYQEISQNQNLSDDINQQKLVKQQAVPQTQFYFLQNKQTEQQSPANFQGFVQNTNLVQAPQLESVLHSNLNQNNTFYNNRFQSQNYQNQNQNIEREQNSTKIDQQLKTSYMKHIYIVLVIYEILILSCLILLYLDRYSVIAANLLISVQVFVIVSFILLYYIWVIETLFYRLIALRFRVFFLFLSEILEIASLSLGIRNARNTSLYVVFTMQFCFTIYFYYFYTKKDYETFQNFRKRQQQRQDNILDQSQVANQSQLQFIHHYPN